MSIIDLSCFVLFCSALLCLALLLSFTFFPDIEEEKQIKSIIEHFDSVTLAFWSFV